jgi:hypothetical protein
MPRNALLIDLDQSDLAWASGQNRYACLIVRAIQRKLPEAIRVTADAKHITFTIPEDGEDGIRYVCDTERPIVDNIIEPFDNGKITKLADIPEDYRTFSIVAREAIPVQHRGSPVRRAAARRRSARPRTQSHRVRTYNRFLDTVAEAATEEEGSE